MIKYECKTINRLIKIVFNGEEDMAKLFGIIDIGSNSVRLMISDGDKSLKKYVNTTKLAEGLAKTGVLNDFAMERSLQAVCEFVQMAQKQNAQVHIFATEAVRSAKNGNVFTDKIKELTGQVVDIVCGEMEAKLGFTGASNGQNVCVVDIGGASTEIVCGDKGKILYGKSVPIGAVRLLDNCGEDEELLTKYISDNLLCYGKVPKMDKLIAIGGTASTIVSVLLEMSEYDSDRVHNFILYKQDVLDVYNKIKNTPKDKRDNIIGLVPGRRDIIVGAAFELAKIMEMLGYDYLYVSESDNLEGYLMLNKSNW